MSTSVKQSNPVVPELVKRLKEQINVTVSIAYFWDNSLDYYDIVHIQWPEELFKWQIINQKDIEDLKRQLGVCRTHHP